MLRPVIVRSIYCYSISHWFISALLYQNWREVSDTSRQLIRGPHLRFLAIFASGHSQPHSVAAQADRLVPFGVRKGSIEILARGKDRLADLLVLRLGGRLKAAVAVRKDDVQLLLHLR